MDPLQILNGRGTELHGGRFAPVGYERRVFGRLGRRCVGGSAGPEETTRRDIPNLVGPNIRE